LKKLRENGKNLLTNGRENGIIFTYIGITMLFFCSVRPKTRTKRDKEHATTAHLGGISNEARFCYEEV